MANPSWTDYVGPIAGIVGMVTGIFGSVMGYLGYRSSHLSKSFDLRVALRKDLAETCELVTLIRQTMAEAEGSRKNVLAARGLANSGAMDVWLQLLKTDREEVTKIAATIPSEGTDFSAMADAQLEAEIIATHKRKTNLCALREKYQETLAEDADVRRQISQQQTAMAAARMGQTPPRGPYG